MIGISIYNIYTGKKEIYFHVLIACNLVTSIFLYPSVNSGHSIVILSITFSSFVALFYLFVYGKLKFLQSSKVLIFLGTVSYPLYLLHENIGLIIINYFDTNFDLRNISVALAIIISIILAYIVTFYIEPPLKNVINKLKINAKN
jgi:peptidoglycan/LPS O-acetylase OafA/YrhL